MSDIETDSRFPSGKWTGYFFQKEVSGRHADLLDIGPKTAENGIIKPGRLSNPHDDNPISPTDSSRD